MQTSAESEFPSVFRLCLCIHFRWEHYKLTQCFWTLHCTWCKPLPEELKVDGTS